MNDTFYHCFADQFLLFKGTRGCCCWLSLFFMAKRIEIGIGSIAVLNTSGPIIALGLYELGFMILLIEVDFIGSRQLFVLFWRSLSPWFRSCLLWLRSLIWSWDTSALSSLLLSQRPECYSKSLSIIFLWQTVQGLVRAPQLSMCFSISQAGQLFSQNLQSWGLLGQLSTC